ncbi:MAG: NAD(P)-dependent oxidoreductase [Alphaproteobacteria bacterium]|nr:NAD(P)-dependent oxidoreductase [Alphaproteobacteria bacterium]
MTHVAILGLGAMGSRLTRVLLAAGQSVTVWNRTADRAEPQRALGAAVAPTPRMAAAGADIVLSILTDDAAAEAVWFDNTTGAMAGMRPGAVAVESSTTSPRWIARLGAAGDHAGVDVLDAPLVGSLPQAEAGQVIFLVGGPSQAVERIRPVLQPMASTVLSVGPRGQGAVLKLMVNSLFAAQLHSLAEGLGFLSRSGLNSATAAALLSHVPIVAPPLVGAARLMAMGDHTPLFTVDLIEKDLGYALAAAAEVNATLPMANCARVGFQSVQAAGEGDRNVSAIARLFV